eukprot:GFKZ01002565.1.p1 GENE.GFKZ01002565.1~~GFKZ01002565.1.p1  ORF type:complete len:150 (-),score=14.03 GFKZ01002565.1:117-503(-)
MPFVTMVPSSRTSVIARSGGKVNISQQGLNSVKDDVVRKNLQGVSDSMKKNDWADASGRKGKKYGVYRFQDKYGANVDGYSPIYTPDTWAEGEQYSLGVRGLLVWAGLLLVILGVGINLVLSTSQLGQ